jgi:hypothetical protein
MPDGTGLTSSAKISERTSMSASPNSMRSPLRQALRQMGYKPFCAIYSTFLQRAYDQVSTTWRSRNCRSAFRSTGRVWSAPTGDPCRQFRHGVSFLPAGLCGHGGGRRGGTAPHGGDRAAYDEGPIASAIRAAKVSASTAGARLSWKSARGLSGARAQRWRCSASADA